MRNDKKVLFAEVSRVRAQFRSSFRGKDKRITIVNVLMLVPFRSIIG